MATIKFDEDENLGKVIDPTQTKMMCFGAQPITDLDELRMYAGGSKFSQLCAFRFISASEEIEYPYFSIAFVAKIRSKIYKKSPHAAIGWYAFKFISIGQKDVLDKQALLVNYGFDIDKFFQSDLFEKMSKKMQATCIKGLKVDIPRFYQQFKNAKTQQDIEIREKIKVYFNAIKESIPLITSHTFNDKYYELKNLQINPDLTQGYEELDRRKAEEQHRAKAAQQATKKSTKPRRVKGAEKLKDKAKQVVAKAAKEIDTQYDVKKLQDVVAKYKAAIKSGRFAQMSSTQKAAFANIQKYIDAHQSELETVDEVESNDILKTAATALNCVVKFNENPDALSKDVLSWLGNFAETTQKEINSINEADYDNPVMRLLNPCGINASTANLKRQNTVQYTEILDEDESNDDFTCGVKHVKDREGYDWQVYVLRTNEFVAGFDDEAIAHEFAEEYPILKKKYLAHTKKNIK